MASTKDTARTNSETSGRSVANNISRLAKTMPDVSSLNQKEDNAEIEDLYQVKTQVPQSEFSPQQFPDTQKPVQQKKNNTGLPDNLKSGVEELSGFSMDDVQVHYNSEKPTALQAHAYAQGTDIHIGPGQEEHLPHEAWHVAQQKQGRVQATKQLKGKIDINDDDGLENEADLMGEKALEAKNDKSNNGEKTDTDHPFQRKKTGQSSPVVQRKRIKVKVRGVTHTVKPKDRSIFAGKKVHTLRDGVELEINDVAGYVSRRGPNQEVPEHRELDEMASYTYPWHQVLKIDDEDVDQDVYVREDTISGKGFTQKGGTPADHRKRASGKESGPGDVLKTVGKGVGKGLFNAILPVFAVADYVNNIRQIHKERETGTSPWGKSPLWSVLAGAIETGQLIATIATAVGIVSALVALIPGAQAAAVVASLVGIIAAIAHAVTGGLRMISMARLGYRWHSASSTLRKAQASKKFWSELGGFAGNAIGCLGGGLLGGFDLSSVGSASTAVASGGTAAAAQVESTAIGAGIGQIYNTDADMAGALGEYWSSEVKSKVNLGEANLLRYRAAKDAQKAKAEEPELYKASSEAESMGPQLEGLDANLASLPETANSASSGAAPSETEVNEAGENLNKAEVDAESIGARVTESELADGEEITESDFLNSGVNQTKAKPVVQRGVFSWIKKAKISLFGKMGRFKKAARKLYLKVKAKLVDKVLQMLGIKEPFKQSQAELTEQSGKAPAIKDAFLEESLEATTAMEAVEDLESKIIK